jgi:hypothetical protein
MANSNVPTEAVVSEEIAPGFKWSPRVRHQTPLLPEGAIEDIGTEEHLLPEPTKKLKGKLLISRFREMVDKETYGEIPLGSVREAYKSGRFSSILTLLKPKDIAFFMTAGEMRSILMSILTQAVAKGRISFEESREFREKVPFDKIIDKNQLVSILTEVKDRIERTKPGFLSRMMGNEGGGGHVSLMTINGPKVANNTARLILCSASASLRVSHH